MQIYDCAQYTALTVSQCKYVNMEYNKIAIGSSNFAVDRDIYLIFQNNLKTFIN